VPFFAEMWDFGIVDKLDALFRGKPLSNNLLLLKTIQLLAKGERMPF